MPSESEIEISKLLHSSFNGGPGEKIGLRDLSRMWSLEMQWFSPEDSKDIAERLLASGWLIGEEDSLSPCHSVSDHVPELGWRPFLSTFGEIPMPPHPPEERIASTVEIPAPTTLAEQSNSEGREGKLVYLIASMSGLEKREVIRRAQRKRRALGPVSLEVAMLLLAREQNLEMDRLVDNS